MSDCAGASASDGVDADGGAGTGAGAGVDTGDGVGLLPTKPAVTVGPEQVSVVKTY